VNERRIKRTVSKKPVVKGKRARDHRSVQLNSRGRGITRKAFDLREGQPNHVLKEREHRDSTINEETRDSVETGALMGGPLLEERDC